MARLIDGVTAFAAGFMILYSVAIGDWGMAAMTAVVALGLVGYRRGWIRRFGR